MIRENQKKNIAAEVARGSESFEAAQILIAAGKLADAVSRAYYAVFHYVRALLLTTGEEPRTHAGVERLLHRDFVRTGVLHPDTAKLFSRLQKFREDADYTAEFVFTPEGASDEIAAPKTFIDAARAILVAGAWL